LANFEALKSEAWFLRTTKRPQNVTLEAAGRAMGYKRVWQKMRRT
jgi:hypothetical protein